MFTFVYFLRKLQLARTKSKFKCVYLYILHRSDSIQGTDYIATPIEGFLGQKLSI